MAKSLTRINGLLNRLFVGQALEQQVYTVSAQKREEIADFFEEELTKFYAHKSEPFNATTK